jgi:hypothetical protein
VAANRSVVDTEYAYQVGLLGEVGYRNAILSFAYTKGFRDGFWLRLRYAHLWEEGGRTGQQVRDTLNFPMSLL